MASRSLWHSAGVHAQARLETRLQALQEERNRNAAGAIRLIHPKPQCALHCAAPRFGRRFVPPSAAAERWGRPAAAVRRRDGVAGSAAESSAAAVQICGGSSITTWTCRRPMQTCAIRARLPFTALRLSTPSITWSSSLCRPRQAVVARRANDDAHAQPMRMLVQSAPLSIGHTESERFRRFRRRWLALLHAASIGLHRVFAFLERTVRSGWHSRILAL